MFTSEFIKNNPARFKTRAFRLHSMSGVELNILMLQFVVLIGVLMGAGWVLTTAASEEMLDVAYLLVIGVSIWSIWSWYLLTKSLFDPYMIFFIGAIVFNGGQTFLEMFGLHQYSLLDKFSVDITLQTLLFVALGLSSMHFGAILSVANSLRESSVPSTPSPNRQEIYTVGWGLFAMSFIPALLSLRDAIATVMASGYFGLYERTAKIGAENMNQLLAAFLIPAMFFVLVGSGKRRFGLIFSGIVILVYVAIQFFLGTRGVASMPLVAYAWLWHRAIRPLPKTLLLVLALVLLIVVFPIIKETRNISGEQRLSLDELSQTFFSIENPVITSLSEMGASLQTIAWTIALIPTQRPYDMGVSYLYASSTILPNLFWDVHPAVKRELPGTWLIWTIDPFIASRGGGIGYSFLAEAYFNFGWFGVIALGVFGFFYVRLMFAWTMKSNDPLKMASMASFLSFVLFFVRQDSTHLFRSFVWYTLIPYAGVYILSRFSQKKAIEKPKLLYKGARI